MAKYRLTEAHYIGEQYLKEGVEVGDGTSVPFAGVPSMGMEGVDEEGKRRVALRQSGVKTLDQFLAEEPAPVAKPAPVPTTPTKVISK